MSAGTSTSLKVLLAEPDIDRRFRIREVLRNARKVDTTDARSLTNLVDALKQRRFDLTIVSSAFTGEELEWLFKNLPNGLTIDQLCLVIALRPEQRAASFVAEMYAKGVVGFICEPFSVTEVSEILRLAEEAQQKPVEESTKNTLASTFLFGDALKQFERIIALRMQGQQSMGFLGREFRDNCMALRDTAAGLSNEQLADMILAQVADAKPREVDESRRASREKLGPAIHPGAELLALMSSRKLSKEKLVAALKIPEVELGEILAGRRGITEETAENISRAIGRTKQYWLSLQKKYDAWQAQLEEERKGL